MDDKNKMLIDAAHPEETRVAVLRNNRVVEFDYESATKKPLRGNIYLAKVTRVEPSVQAAFVDYGGNRHGFLAFNEIHPDYYQIPVADRQALLDEEAEEARAASAAEERDDETAEGNRGSRRGRSRGNRGGRKARSREVSSPEDGEIASESDAPKGQDRSADVDPEAHEAATSVVQEATETTSESAAPSMPQRFATALEKLGLGDAFMRNTRSEASEVSERPISEADAQSAEVAELGATSEAIVDDASAQQALGLEDDDNDGNGEEDEDVESVGSEDVLEEVPERTRRARRQYKIQEVIRRRQVVLVQVVKEERGNKGAALTTYLSLAGRYTVLMPNTARGGGISRKITNPTDRKRLRKIAAELDVPQGMGLIIRTAGAARTKAEIKRDFEYLLRLWENVRDLTLKSTAPTLIYEEGDLIKRSIRDLYSKEIDEVLVAGEEAYRDAKDFMRMLMPSHAKNVQPYKESQPLFTRFQIERQLNAMFSPVVTLRSGGYIVINQTEALVAIDVNSGRSTREHSIEETALNTNLEAAEELSRQLKLRDLAGLIVVDFIDMEERRNNRSVEHRLKDCLKNDRARIQVGRISHFGLLEMSRQRLRTGVLEGSTSQCPHCQGTGVIRSVESVALSVLRGLEEALMGGETNDLTAKTSVETSLYILNQKRSYMRDIEARYGIEIMVVADERLQGATYTIERTSSEAQGKRGENVVVQMDWAFTSPEDGDQESESMAKKARKRRRRRKGQDDQRDGEVELEADSTEINTEEIEDKGESKTGGEALASNDDGARSKRTRRRGKRGGRRNRRESGGEKVADEAALSQSDETPATSEVQFADVESDDQPVIEQSADSQPREVETSDDEPSRGRTRRRRRRAPRGNGNAASPASEVAVDVKQSETTPAELPITFKGDEPQANEPIASGATASGEIGDTKTEEPKPRRKSKPRRSPAESEGEPTDNVAESSTAAPPPVAPELAASSDEVLQPEIRRSGWWQKRTDE